MEPLVVWLLIFVVFFCVLYFTVKAAVRDGILAARQAQREEPPQQDAPNEKKGWLNAILFSFIHGVLPHPRRRGTLRALGVF